MRHTTIGRNYAEALYSLGQKRGEAEAYADAFIELDRALASDLRIRRFLETPKIDPPAKQAVLRSALEGRVPEAFLNFVLVVVAKHRQGRLHAIREEYDVILDERAGRVQAEVTLARQPDERLIEEIRSRLSTMLGKTVVANVHVNPAILGGIVVRYGDRVLDGSVRRQLASLKREMMHAGLPQGAAVGA